MTACNTSIDAIAGKAIETIENLTASEPPHRLISAVLDEQAGQCGYCLPGILMQAKALLTKTPKPTREQIVQALDSNLCRCGAHNRIVRAIETAAMAGNNDDR
jgi:nicotinate dehydrogenase subunit A